ncbi:MAG TPA: VCBS repeat-containing protein [Isosphaeraceae bacterium]|nr:VCBS repeat-containing protein [Isosphaeraceae bacterium]
MIDADFPAGYQVEVADVNGDGKPDIVGVGGATCAWYENPSWKKRIIAGAKQTPGIISSATADLDRDGKAEVAIAYDFEMNRPRRGKLALATQGATADAPWTLRPIATIQSIHRLRWGDIDGDGQPELVVAPIFGPTAAPPSYDQAPATLVVFRAGFQPKAGNWIMEVVGDRPVLHAIEVRDLGEPGHASILTASNLGVSMYSQRAGTLDWRRIDLTAGAPGRAPKRGSSEVHLGKLADGRRFVATIEPWHGSEVAVCLGETPGALKFGPRAVPDDTLDDGHALWVADFDGDGDDEILAGHRGRDARVSAFDFERASKTWTRTVVDRAITAQDLRGGDLDGDGTPDAVAIGGKSHNIVWYRPLRAASK